jgi:hypothetical protein
MVIEEHLKAATVFDHFDGILGTSKERVCSLDFGRLGLPSLDLSSLDSCFSEQEVWSIIHALSPDNASGPDGFTWRFYQTAWSVIKRDVLQALIALWSLDDHSFYLLNQALIILLRKKENATEVTDFWPISLIHSFSNLFAKLLSTRLAPHMKSLVKPNQSAFIHGRVIHDNFKAVQSMVKLLYARRQACILLKVDITKAFDMVAWSFLVELLRHVGLFVPIKADIDRVCCSFVWVGTTSASDGKCMVAWSRVTRPSKLGGLGILDLTAMGYALQLWWEWLAREDLDMAWMALPSKMEVTVRAMLEVSTIVQVGNGA